MRRWGNWTLVFVALLVLLFGTGNYWSATWLSKWALLMALSIGTMSFWAAQRTSLAYLPLFLYVGGSLLYLAAWQNPYQQTLDPLTFLALQKNALYGLVSFTMSVVLFTTLPKSVGPTTTVSLALIWVVGVAGILSLPLTGAHSAPNNGLWFGNPSMGASLLACLLPFVWVLGSNLKRPRLLMLTAFSLTLIAIIKTRASVPWGVLGVVTIAAIAANTSRRRGSWLWVLLSFAGIAAFLSSLGMRLLGSDFWDQNGRFEIWKMALDWFKTHGNVWFGMGFSSTQVLLPLEQVVTGHYHGDYFLWLHNDWLQIFIEGGYLGAVCVGIAALRLLWVARHRWPFASIAGFYTLALFNYPARMPIHCFCFLLIAAMSERTNQSVGTHAPTQAPGVRKKRLVPA